MQQPNEKQFWQRRIKLKMNIILEYKKYFYDVSL